MAECLEFKKARCKNCYKCLRECPVKAIEVTNHQAKIIEDRCILCGRCTEVCPQNAKYVHSEKESVKALLASGEKIVASVAPSFVGSFGADDFSVMKIALAKLGFRDAEETAVGANAVTERYAEDLKSGKYKNYITSACPAIDRLIQIYYPKALPYLANVDTPMIAHAKMLKKRFADAKVVFIGPCIAKKREGFESDVVDGVLTFEDLRDLFAEKGIDLNTIAKFDYGVKEENNKARYYPINRGIIKSFQNFEKNYEYVSVDGVSRVMEVLENIDNLSGMFLEVNACEFGCVNGPCSLQEAGSALKRTAEVRRYANRNEGLPEVVLKPNLDFTKSFPRLRNKARPASEREIDAILRSTGKYKPEDELNCGACGYATCREKAWAVINGYAPVDICLPYMRERAESMSYEIIQNSPNGIAIVDGDLKLVDINLKAMELWGIEERDVKGRDLVDFFNPTDFVIALSEARNLTRKKVKIDKTNRFAEMTISLLKEHKMMFCIMKDITEGVNYDEKLRKMKLETVETTDEVIKKQMRVAQEIASLLGETTAETKVALLKLKKTLKGEEAKDE